MKVRYFRNSGALVIVHDPSTEKALMDKLSAWMFDTLGLEWDDDTMLGIAREKVTFSDLLECLDDTFNEELEIRQRHGLNPGIVLRGAQWHASIDVEHPHLTAKAGEVFEALGKAITKWQKDGRRFKGEETSVLIEKKIEELEDAQDKREVKMRTGR